MPTLHNSTLHFLLYAGMAYFMAANLIYVVLLVGGIWDIKRWRGKHAGKSGTILPAISVIAPAFNMENSILPSIAGLLSLDYPDFEIIVVNDGSSDRTLELLTQAYSLARAPIPATTPLCRATIRGIYTSPVNSRLRVIDKVNGGHKADALNAGITYVRHELFCAVDSDSLLETGALRQIVKPFLRDPRRMIASGGTIRVINESVFQDGKIQQARVSKNPLVFFQIVEYIRAFYTGRTAWNRFNSLLIISGAFGLFKTAAVKAVGGYGVAAIGEDMELVMRLHHDCRKKNIPYKMGFVPEAVCWTEVPETLHSLYVQRHRWQRGLLDSLTTHWRMFLNPRYGAIAFVAIPYFIFVEAIGPMLEVILWGLLFVANSRGILGYGFWLAFVLVSLSFSWALSMCSICVEIIYFSRYSRVRDFLLLTAATIFEPFGYRQITAVWRLVGTLAFLRRDKGWGKLKRRGFGTGNRLAKIEKQHHHRPEL